VPNWATPPRRPIDPPACSGASPPRSLARPQQSRGDQRCDRADLHHREHDLDAAADANADAVQRREEEDACDGDEPLRPHAVGHDAASRKNPA
jgi:hypothetical protein